MKRKLLRKRVLIPSIAVFLVCGAAIAAWVITSQGQGGKGSIGTLTAPTISNPTTSAATPCYPGGTCDFQVSVTNPNTGPLVLKSWSPGSATVTVTKAGSPNTLCEQNSPGGIVATLNNLTNLSIPIPAGTTTVTLPGAWSLPSNSPIDCAGSTVSIDTTNQVTYSFATA